MDEVKIFIIDGENEIDGRIKPLLELGYKPQFVLDIYHHPGWYIFSNKKLANYGFKASNFSNLASSLVNNEEFERLLTRAYCNIFEIDDYGVNNEYDEATIEDVFRLIILDKNVEEPAIINSVAFKMVDLEYNPCETDIEFESL